MGPETQVNEDGEDGEEEGFPHDAFASRGLQAEMRTPSDEQRVTPEYKAVLHEKLTGGTGMTFSPDLRGNPFRC